MTDQPSPYSDGATLERLLAEAERERLRDAEETVRVLTAELTELREAARAVVDMTDLESCGVCLHVATVYVDRNGYEDCYCDTHEKEFGNGWSKDMRNAAVWRRLVEKVKP
jgi:hypothetical protein